MSAGQFALEALDAFRVERLQPPEWVIRRIVNCYRDFKQGAPSAGFLEDVLSRPAARTLGEAFGVPDISGEHMRTRRLKALKMPYLLALFAGPDAPPRTKDGYKIAAKALGITAAQAEDWLPATRQNSRTYAASLEPASALAHDPFGQLKPPKNEK